MSIKIQSRIYINCQMKQSADAVYREFHAAIGNNSIHEIKPSI